MTHFGFRISDFGWKVLRFCGLRFFVQDFAQMDIERRGFVVTTPEHRAKVEGIGRAFLTGYNTMLTQGVDAVRAACESFSPFFKPFAYEGAAMGFVPLTMFSRYRLRDFENAMQSLNPNYLYLQYVGFGFWHGMLAKVGGARMLTRRVEQLHPIYRYLCFDGYGFKLGFFDFPRNPQAVEREILFRLDGYARHAAFQGLGRSLWFVFMDDVERLIATIESWDEAYRGDGFGGLGLAVAFTHADDLGFAFDFVAHVPEAYHGEYWLGVTFACAARRMNDADYFAGAAQRLDASRQEAVWQALQVCDDCFAQASSRQVGSDGYANWRKWVVERLSREGVFEEAVRMA